MPILSWIKALETGHEEIDGDHRVLVDLLNQVQVASQSGNRVEVMAILRELERYTEYHFGHEEALMAEFDYVSADIHRAEHRQTLRDIRNYIDDFASGRIVASSVALYMQRWLIHHIVGPDRQLGAALARAGATRVVA